MICPRCKTGDVHISQRNNAHLLSFLWVNMRCHRCCNLFTVSRWRAAGPTEKPAGAERKVV